MSGWSARPTLARREPKADPDGLPAEWHPVLRRVLAARGIGREKDLCPPLSALHPPESLGGVEEATGLLASAMFDGAAIVVVGDFDADGATGTALAVRALRAMGHGAVDFVVPNRFRHGYGLSPALVEEALAPLRPDLVMTVDNGVASLAGVRAARQRGMKVLVTDHHLPGEELPDADAMVNPNLPGDPFPSKALAGVGVVFLLMAALRERLRGLDWFGPQRPKPNLAEFLDLVALGTVADLVPLDRHNRILVEQGLKRIRAGRAAAGILALAAAAGRDHRRLVSSDLGFAVAPRLNAAGRLEDMSLGIECLLTADAEHAALLAQRLDGINRERRELQQSMQEQADSALSETLGRLSAADLPWGVTLFEPDWHAGIVGLVASRVKDRLHRPVVAFAPASASGNELKGSARSVRALHIRDTLAAVDARYPELIDRFGGHAMAAGLSLPATHLDEFRRAFDEEVRARLDAEDLENRILTDGELTNADLTIGLAESLRCAGPWGQAFPEPLFEGEFRVRHRRVVGGSHLKMQLSPSDGGGALDAIAFRTGENALGDSDRVRAVYALDVNDFRSRRSLQLRVEYLEPV